MNLCLQSFSGVSHLERRMKEPDPPVINLNNTVLDWSLDCFGDVRKVYRSWRSLENRKQPPGRLNNRDPVSRSPTSPRKSIQVGISVSRGLSDKSGATDSSCINDRGYILGSGVSVCWCTHCALLSSFLARRNNFHSVPAASRRWLGRKLRCAMGVSEVRG